MDSSRLSGTGGNQFRRTEVVSEDPPTGPRLTDLLALQGMAKQAYSSFGGGEEYLRTIRRNFYGDERDLDVNIY